MTTGPDRNERISGVQNKSDTRSPCREIFFRHGASSRSRGWTGDRRREETPRHETRDRSPVSCPVSRVFLLTAARTGIPRHGKSSMWCKTRAAHRTLLLPPRAWAHAWGKYRVFLFSMTSRTRACFAFAAAHQSDLLFDLDRYSECSA